MLKIVKNFQLIVNPKFPKTSKYFKLSQSGKIREATFATKRGPEIIWRSERLGSANTRLLAIKEYGLESAVLIKRTTF
jgi:hypothetical protein